jgi:hypothetical protein
VELRIDSATRHRAMFAISGTDRIGRFVVIDQTLKFINDEG